MKQQPKNQKKINNHRETVGPKPFRWTPFLGKVLLLFAIVSAVVIFTDKKGYFKADQTNNHMDRKWKSFYKFTKTKKVDVLLAGNSHIITGIDPFVLSCATGTNCFILGTSGVDIVDTYFSLGEALKHTKPEVVVIETYAIGIGGEEKDKGNMFQIMSFEAHEDFWYKLRTMPELFHSDSWVKAWSPTIRNHSFLLTNQEQIAFNKKNGNRAINQNRLDLGRFARFTEGLQPETLAKYDSLGAPIDGSKYTISSRNKKYLKKTMDLCKERGIPVLFITVPMYYKHVSHYEQWKATLAEELKKYPEAQWLDWQMPYDSLRFTPEAFENTYESNQHLSNYGMTVTAYKLAAYLMQNNPYRLPDRSKEPEWIADFKDQPHFLFNQPLPSGTNGCYSVEKNRQIGGIFVKDLIVQQNQNSNIVILKTENRSDLPPSIHAMFALQHQNQVISGMVQMDSYGDIFPPQNKIYVANMRSDVKLLDILAISSVQ